MNINAISGMIAPILFLGAVIYSSMRDPNLTKGWAIIQLVTVFLAGAMFGPNLEEFLYSPGGTQSPIIWLWLIALGVALALIYYSKRDKQPGMHPRR